MTQTDILALLRREIAAFPPTEQGEVAVYAGFLRDWLRRHGAFGRVAFALVMAEYGAESEARAQTEKDEDL